MIIRMEMHQEKSNYHTHCGLDDGYGTLEEYVLSALSKGFTSLGFSCHTPGKLVDDWHMKTEDFPYYLEEINRLKQIYSDRIEIYTGLELDYLEETGELVGSQFMEHLDFTIASVHMIKHKMSDAYLSVDGPIEEFTTLLKDNFNNDIKEFVHYYYQLEEKLVSEHSFDILGHCDLIKKHNKDNCFFDAQEQWYTKIADHFLETAAKNHTRIEINTGGIARGATKEVYPSPSMIETCHNLSIPVTLNSDAHESSNLDFFFSSADDLLVQQGYRSIDMLIHGIWQEIPII